MLPLATAIEIISQKLLGTFLKLSLIIKILLMIYLP